MKTHSHSRNKQFSKILFLTLIALAFVMSCKLAAQPTQVIAWGSNGSGQTNTPSSLTNAIAVSAKGYFSTALRADGTAEAWGSFFAGQLNIPPSLTNVVALGTGWSHTLAIRDDGTVVAWGSSFYGETNVPSGLSNVVAVAGGGYFSLALRADGTVVGWGDGSSGQLDIPPGMSDVVAIDAGFYHSLALKRDGTVVAWGITNSSDHEILAAVPGGLSNVVSIAAANSHNLALKFDGTLQAWAPDWNTDATNIPTAATNLLQISAGGSHSLVLRKDGTVVAWGCTCGGATVVPPGLTNVSAIAAAGNDEIDHNLVLTGLSYPPSSLAVVDNNGAKELRLTGSIRHRYVLEETSDFNSAWSFNRNVILTNETQVVLEIVPANTGARFYRSTFMP